MADDPGVIAAAKRALRGVAVFRYCEPFLEGPFGRLERYF
jgi:hypothetical protein